MNKKAGRIVYIMSDNRSGSTLLDQLLGAHDEICSVGEIHHLQAYANQDRTIYDPEFSLDCACGQAFSRCPFWSSVQSNLGRPLSSLFLKDPKFSLRNHKINAVRKVLNLPRQLIRRYPSLYLNSYVERLFHGGRVARDSFALFDAIFSATEKKLIVDSSKSAILFRSLYNYCPERLFGIMLARDYRGNVFSKVKRGVNFLQATKQWTTSMRAIETMTADVPRNQLTRIRYEDLCNDPRTVLMALCEKLDVQFSENMLSRPTVDVHNLGGSASKFDPKRTTIRLDESYKGAFSQNELEAMRRIASNIAQIWSYD